MYLKKFGLLSSFGLTIEVRFDLFFASFMFYCISIKITKILFLIFPKIN